MHYYTNDRGRLTEAGLALLRARREGETRGLDDVTIQRIFDPWGASITAAQGRTGARWRVFVVESEILQESLPARLVDGELAFSRPFAEGLYATRDGSKITVVNRELSTIFELLPQLHAFGVSESAFLIGGPDDRDLRRWTVARLFAYALRERRDPALIAEYARVHTHYLGAATKDPLSMIRPSDVAQGGLIARNMTLAQFWGIGDDSQPARTRRALRGNLMQLGRQVETGAQHWFRFLFKPSGGGSASTTDGAGFLGELVAGRLYRALDNRSATCEGLSGTGVSDIGRKRPDIVEFSPETRMVSVLDQTMRMLDEWHKFKTAVYTSALAIVLSQASPPWVCSAMDYYSRRLMTPGYASG